MTEPGNRSYAVPITYWEERARKAEAEIERLRAAIWKFVNCHAHSCPRCTPTAIAALEPGND